MEREEQVRHERGRAQVAHLGRARMQHENRRERQREQADLIAEQRDRLPEPETPECQVPQRPRQRQPHLRSVPPVGGVATCCRDGPYPTAGCLSAGPRRNVALQDGAGPIRLSGDLRRSGGRRRIAGPRLNVVPPRHVLNGSGQPESTH